MTEALFRHFCAHRNDIRQISFSGFPVGFKTFSVAISGGVAALNQRLIAAVPPGQRQKPDQAFHKNGCHGFTFFGKAELFGYVVEPWSDGLVEDTKTELPRGSNEIPVRRSHVFCSFLYRPLSFPITLSSQFIS